MLIHSNDKKNVNIFSKLLYGDETGFFFRCRRFITPANEAHLGELCVKKDRALDFPLTVCIMHSWINEKARRSPLILDWAQNLKQSINEQ